jgi:hypothetical protein
MITKSDVVNIAIAVFSFIVVPWLGWVTSSITTQKQELALIRQILDQLTTGSRKTEEV